ncbi:MAG: hypothetical protein ACREOW_04950 [Thermodesulfobacteriota bacterium]
MGEKLYQKFMVTTFGFAMDGVAYVGPSRIPHTPPLVGEDGFSRGTRFPGCWDSSWIWYVGGARVYYHRILIVC